MMRLEVISTHSTEAMVAVFQVWPHMVMTVRWEGCFLVKVRPKRLLHCHAMTSLMVLQVYALCEPLTAYWATECFHVLEVVMFVAF